MMALHADMPTASSLISRRNLLIGATASLLCAPPIVRAASLMPVKVVTRQPLAIRSVERPWPGFVERLAYQAMDDILKAGWTPQRAAWIYGGMSEDRMRTAVAYARRHGFLK
jgi:hypothetical protein